ncbi:MAG TPA: hypothetical protein VMW11_03735 [Candidatus Dormibacteraeota bacterium]|nr:hypothetical protein [Candidatus Dormibacteraeota bacterium]
MITIDPVYDSALNRPGLRRRVYLLALGAHDGVSITSVADFEVLARG